MMKYMSYQMNRDPAAPRLSALNAHRMHAAARLLISRIKKAALRAGFSPAFCVALYDRNYLRMPSFSIRERYLSTSDFLR